MSAPPTPRSPSTNHSPSSSHQPQISVNSEGNPNGAEQQAEDSPLNSDVDMSDDEEGSRSRDSGLLAEEKV